ncbi:putative IPT/TIG domain protein [Paratrimastix pyriformis]|uniref:IPT/TIG domain protein n=1 Tax=Paratrimastix pyriformis TaxID=342808 RepID=A0ABQ8UD88_9EUKA|nr:putative IPT/TIG domain protein [Paratrimastix pyriformis]
MTNPVLSFTDVSSIPAGASFEWFAGGAFQTLVYTDDGRVFGTGTNERHVLLIGTDTTSRSVLTESTLLRPSMGKLFGLTTLSGGSLAWGLAAPTVTGLAPPSSPSGQTVTVTGTHFRTGVTVTVGGLPCANVQLASATSLQCTLDAALPLGSHAVVVNNTDVGLSATLADAITVVEPVLSVSMLSAQAGWEGDFINVTGAGFTAAAKVQLGVSGALLATTFLSATSLQFAVPAQPNATTVTYEVFVTDTATSDQSPSAGITFSYAPTVTLLSGSHGPPGTNVTVTGTNFVDGAKVRLGTASAHLDITATVTSTTSLTFAVPAQSDAEATIHTGAWPLAVLNSASAGSGLSKETVTLAFLYDPVVSSLSSSAGWPGDLVPLTGRNFATTCRVQLGVSGALLATTFLSATSLRFAVPAQPNAATVTYEVFVTDTATGAQSPSAGVTFSYALCGAFLLACILIDSLWNSTPATVTGLSATHGPATATTSVTVTGTNFVSGAKVRLGWADEIIRTTTTVASITSLTFDMPTQAVAETTLGAARSGAWPVAVLNPASAGSGLSKETGAGLTFSYHLLFMVSPPSIPFHGLTPFDVLSMSFSCPFHGLTPFDVLASHHAAIVTGVSPTRIDRATSTSVTVTGRNFYSGALAHLMPLGGSGTAPADITPTSIAAVERSFTFLMPAQASGVADQLEVHVSMPGASGVYSTQTAAILNYVTLPNLVSVVAVTSNAHSPLAKVGDTVVAIFTANVALNLTQFSLPAVMLAGRVASGNLTYTLSGMRDLQGNQQVATITGTLEVVFDSVAPSLTAVTGASNHAGGPTSAAEGDEVAVTLQADEILAGTPLPTVTVAGRPATVQLTASGTAVTATVTMLGSETLGPIPYTLSGSLCDPAGNCNGSLTPASGSTGVTFAMPPVVQSVIPALRPHGTGDVLLEVRGLRFGSNPTVQVAGQPCPVVLANSSRVVCQSAGGLVGGGYVAVEVTNSVGLSERQDNLLWYQGQVTLASITPAAASQTAGTTATLTLTGTGFATGMGGGAACPTVTVGGQPCVALTCPSATSLACTLTVGPAGATNGPAAVVVTNPSPDVATCTTTQAVGAFYFQGPAPTLSGLTPARGPLAGGQTVHLQGSGLRVVAGGLPTVLVGGQPCTGVAADPAGSTAATGLTCTLPAGAALGSVAVVVTNWDQTTVTLDGGYSYQGPIPTVSWRSPAQGPCGGGTALVLVGTGFRAGVTVTVAGSPCTLMASNGTFLNCTTPAGLAASTAVVVITNSDGTNATTDFAYYAVGLSPVINRLTPSSSNQLAAASIIVTGSNFRAGLTLTIGGLTCPGPAVTASRIRCTLPAPGAAYYGPVDVTVTNADGTTATLTRGYTFTGTAAPVVAGVSPSTISLTSAAVAANSPSADVVLTVTGQNFRAGPVVTLGNQTCASPVVDPTGTNITCTLAVGVGCTAGPTALVVTNADGLSSASNVSGGAESAVVLYFQGAAPALSGVTPAQGPCNLGTPVVLQGTNLRAGLTVWVGGQRCLNATLLPATGALSCLVPPAQNAVVAQLAAAATTAVVSVSVDVVVQNDDLTQATLNQTFAYTTALYPARPALSGALFHLLAQPQVCCYHPRPISYIVRLSPPADRLGH